MPHYMMGGCEDHRALHLVPVQGENGVDLPAQLYQRWKDARSELDTVQRTIVAYVQEHAGRDAIPEELRQPRDRAPHAGPAAPARDTW